MVGSSSSSRSGSENSTAASATRMRQPPENSDKRPVLRLLVEAEAAEDARRARRGGMGVDVDEAGLDVGDALRVARALGFRDQRRALDVGREHEVDQRLGAARRLLLDAAEPRALRARGSSRSRAKSRRG